MFHADVQASVLVIIFKVLFTGGGRETDRQTHGIYLNKEFLEVQCTGFQENCAQASKINYFNKNMFERQNMKKSSDM